MKLDSDLWMQCVLWQSGQSIDGNRVEIVDTNFVMTHYDMDFNQGGNDLETHWVEQHFGDHVIILDDRIRQDDYPFIIYHEAHERRLMAKGWNYDDAHESANHAERELRLRERLRA